MKKQAGGILSKVWNECNWTGRKEPGGKALNSIVKSDKASMILNPCDPTMGYQPLSGVSIGTENTKLRFHLI